MEFKELLAKRRSVRAYSEGISEEELNRIMEAVLMAPSWKNAQTGRYYAAVTPEAVQEVYDALPGFNQKSTVHAAYIVCTFKKGIVGNPGEGQDLWGSYDLGLQNAYLLLKAKEAGYDTLIMGLRDEEKLREIFQIPEDEILLPVIAIGKAAEEPALRPRKTLAEILKVK